MRVSVEKFLNFSSLLVVQSVFLGSGVKWSFVVVEKNLILFIHRRLFHVCTFFLFFFNIFLGVVSCLKRILIGAVLGVMFLGRTQKSVISRDFELMDPGWTKTFFFSRYNVLLTSCSKLLHNYHFRWHFNLL